MNFNDVLLFKKYLSPYVFKMAVVIVLTFFCSLFEAVSIGALVPLMQILNGQANPGGTLWTTLESIFTFLHLEMNFYTILLSIVIVFLIGQFLVFIKERIQIGLMFRFASDLRVKIFHEILNTDVSFHYNVKAGKLINAILNESQRAAQGIYAITKLISTIGLILIYAVMLFYISFEITAIIIVVSLISFYIMDRFLKKSTEYGRQGVEITQKLSEFTTERISLVKFIKIFSGESRESISFNDLSEQGFRISYIHSMNGKIIEILFQIILMFIAVTILFLSESVFYVQLPLLLVFLFILIRLTDPLRSINSIRHELTAEIPSLRKIDRIIHRAMSLNTINSGNIRFDTLHDSITLDRINFEYRQNTPVLKNVSISIRKNEMVALVGVSGGGKSTIVDLIIRLLDPDTGRILVDGIDLKAYDLKSFRNKLGVVSQDSFIFNDTVLNNICYGAESISPDLAVESAKIAFAHEFIMDLPEKYDTRLGDRGVNLSGGQKQRIAIARAIYRNPDILIFDEATSALDSESEKKIQESINNLRHKYTIIAIAHRLSTIENADNIIVLEKGEVVEEGSHSELLIQNKYYAKYYQMQYGGNS